MKPYANESEVLDIGADLTVENRTDCVSIHGSVDLTRDQAGLARARALLQVLQDTVAALEGVADLPAVLPARPVRKVANPFR